MYRAAKAKKIAITMAIRVARTAFIRAEFLIPQRLGSVDAGKKKTAHIEYGMPGTKLMAALLHQIIMMMRLSL
jgi:hypothetical protein